MAGMEPPQATGYCHMNENGKNTCFRIGLFGEDLEIFQLPADQSVGHGAVVWDSAAVYVKYMEHNSKDFEPRKLQGKRVLELGSGTGLAGIAYMMRGAGVTFTDLPPVVANLTERNVMSAFRQLQYSGLDVIRPSIRTLDWTECKEEQQEGNAPMSPLLNGPYDTILLTDCVFSSELIPSLVATIRRHAQHKTTVICCYELRDETISEGFLRELGESFSWKRLARTKLHPEFSNELIHIIVGKLRRVASTSTIVTSAAASPDEAIHGGAACPSPSTATSR